MAVHQLSASSLAVMSRYFTYVGTAATIAGVVAVDVAGDVGEGEVTQFDAGVVRSVNRAGAALVDVGLGDEDWEGDIVDADVAPGDIC